jgi:hypothetical protein
LSSTLRSLVSEGFLNMTRKSASTKGREGPIAPDDPEQFQRFVEAARELGIEELGEPYERAVDAVLRAPKPDAPMQTRIKRPRRKKDQP